MVRTHVTLASTSRPALSSIRSWVVAAANSGRSRSSANMWLARFSGVGDPLQHQRVDLLVEHRRIDGGVRGGQSGPAFCR